MQTPNFMPPPEKQFYSLGTVSQHFQQSPQQVLELATRVGVEPDHWMNGVPVFRGDAVEAMLDKLNSKRTAIKKAAAQN